MKTRTMNARYAWLWLAVAVVLAGCAPPPDERDDQEEEAVGQAQSEVFTNGGFETGPANNPPPAPWTVTTYLNSTGVTITTPQTRAGLNLATGGNALTTEIAAVNQPEPDLGVPASLRLCRFGAQCGGSTSTATTTTATPAT